MGRFRPYLSRLNGMRVIGHCRKRSFFCLSTNPDGPFTVVDFVVTSAQRGATGRITKSSKCLKPFYSGPLRSPVSRFESRWGKRADGSSNYLFTSRRRLATTTRNPTPTVNIIHPDGSGANSIRRIPIDPVWRSQGASLLGKSHLTSCGATN